MVLASYKVEWTEGETKKSFGGMEMFHDPMSEELFETLPERIARMHGAVPNEVTICGICEIGDFE